MGTYKKENNYTAIETNEEQDDDRVFGYDIEDDKDDEHDNIHLRKEISKVEILDNQIRHLQLKRQEIIKNEEEKNEIFVSCLYCGSVINKADVNGKLGCPYCGANISKAKRASSRKIIEIDNEIKKLEERKNNFKEEDVLNRKKRIKSILIAVVILLTLSIISGTISSLIPKEPTEKEIYLNREQEYIHLGYIQINISSEDIKKNNVFSAENILKARGFFNIYKEPVHDLITGIITKKYSIDTITIAGNSSWHEYEYFSPISPIVITYHDF